MTIIEFLFWLFILFILVFYFYNYSITGCFSWLFHDILKIHVPKEATIITDSITDYAVCRYCNKVIKKNKFGFWI